MFNPYWMAAAPPAAAALVFAVAQVRQLRRRKNLRGPSAGFTIDLDSLTEELTSPLPQSFDSPDFPEPRLSGHTALPWWRRYG